MGGRIDVETEPAQGSTFRVSVSLRRGQSLNIASADTAFDGAADMGAGGLHILVAEDNEVNQHVVRAMLASLGHSCEMACDGLEVVAKVTAARFDLILMDIQMPNLDGLAATRRIRALGGSVAQIPIIALTANAMVEDKQAYIEAGMNDHVAKPIELGKLALTITRVLSLEQQV